MSNALEITQGIVNLLKYHVQAETLLMKDCLLGETGIYIASSQYAVGDHIALKSSETDKIELHEVTCVSTDKNGFFVLHFSRPSTCTFDKNDTRVYKTYGKQLVNHVYLSNPNTIPDPPSLVVELLEESQQPFTLGSVKETYQFAISCHVSGVDPEASQKQLLKLTYAVKKALFKQIYPLIEPYKVNDIVEDVQRDSLIIKIAPTHGLNGANEVLIFDEFDRLRPNAVDRHLGNGVVQIKFAVGLDYPKFAVRPFTNTFDPRVESIAYNTQSDNDLIVRKSIVQYSISCMKERRC